jgi:excisionase family DNA binding protein
MTTNGHNPAPVTKEASGRESDSLDPLLTVEEVAKLLKVPVSWVYERTRQRSLDRIPGFRLGRYWRFRERDVVTWIERQKVGARPNA